MNASIRLQGFLRAAFTATLLTLGASPPGIADPLAELPRRLSQGQPNLDVRLRHEYLHLAAPLPVPVTNSRAQATTLRIRLGYTTAAWNGFDGQLEYEGVETLGDDRYQSLANGRSQYPVIADAEIHELNQAWLRYAGLPQTQLRYGRQRLNFDNQRHVGSVAWRQDEQTFDAAYLSTTLIPHSRLQYAHLDRVNSFRHFAIDGRTVDQLDIDGHLLNLSWSLLDTRLQLTGYGYFLDFGAVPDGAAGRLLSNQKTCGLRATGALPAAGVDLGYTLEYARQQGWRGSPDRDLRYALIEASAGWKPLKASAGYEVLGGDGRSGLQTPLATTHAFDGWADQFLITPAGGLQRIYAALSLRHAGSSLTVVGHDFSADAGGLHYGSEIDLLASQALQPTLTLFAKFAAYFGDAEAAPAGKNGDVQRGWLYAEFRF